MEERQSTGFRDREGNEVHVGDLFLTLDSVKGLALLEVCTDGFGSYFLEPYEGIADRRPIEWVEDAVIEGHVNDWCDGDLEG